MMNAADVDERDKRDLQVRTKSFALRVVRLHCSLPKTTEAQVLGKQLLRSGTSVGAHYREATRARSVAEFISKVEGGLQELEETASWIELLIDSGIVPETKLMNLHQEAGELIAMLVASARTAKGRRSS